MQTDENSENSFHERKLHHLLYLYTHALMETCFIDAIEGRDVAKKDITGVFLQATMDDDVYIKFEGKMVDVLIGLGSANYCPCVCSYKGQQFIYAKANKNNYGPLRAALLFYQLFSRELMK